MITFERSEGITRLPVAEQAIKRWIRECVVLYGFKAGDINYRIVGDPEILEVNKQYLNHDYYTDIITFDYSIDGELSADIFISLDTVRSNSNKYNTTLKDEFLRVVIHGVLHLIGFKDKTKKQEVEMREQENRCLSMFHVKHS